MKHRYIDVIVTQDPNPGPTDFSGRPLPVEEVVAERIIQEEVWAQTLWPEGVLPLAEVIAALDHLTGAIRTNGELDLNAAERFLAAIRDSRKS